MKTKFSLTGLQRLILHFSLKSQYGRVLWLALIGLFLGLACSLISNMPRSTGNKPSNSQSEEATSEYKNQIQASDVVLLYPIIDCNRKYGYINQRGVLVIPYQFEQAAFFHDGLAVVGSTGSINFETFESEEGNYGYIDVTGNYVIQPIFPKAGSFSEGLAAAASPTDPDRYGFIDKTGQFVIEPKYFGDLSDFKWESPDKRDFHEGYAVVENVRNTQMDDWLFIYIDRKGNALVPPGPVKQATYFSNGLAIIQTTSFKTEIINTNGKVVAQINDCNFNNCSVGPFSEGLASISTSSGTGKLTGFIDESGKIVIDKQFDEAMPFSEGLSLVFDADTQRWGYINRSGVLVIPYQYEQAGRFSEGLAPIMLPDGKSGYIDKNGVLVIQLEDMIIPDSPVTIPSSGGIFHDGLALVENVNFHAYIDKNGHFVYQIDNTSCP